MSKGKKIKGAIFTLLLLFAYVFIIFPLNHYVSGSDFLINSYEMTTNNGVVVVHKMYGLLDVAPEKERRAEIGGFPIAMALYTDGVIVDDTAPVETAFGRTNPAANFRRGDLIIELNGKKVSESADIEKIISADLHNNNHSKDESAGGSLIDAKNGNKRILRGSDLMGSGTGDPMSVKVLRAGEEKTFDISPAKEEFSNKYRLGLVVRDYLLGVGMVTYINSDGTFAALGHPISDGTAGRVPIRCGIAYNCEQIGITKGERGSAGELRVKVDGSRKPIGEIYKSTGSGIYGKFYDDFERKNYPIASRRQVKVGEAYIYTTVSQNGSAEYYKAEIIRAVNQSEKSDKGLILRVTDSRLLQLTGGIVQGMSGSPIIQNERIIGAVTHVFVNDPTKGYGIYMDFMYEK